MPIDIISIGLCISFLMHGFHILDKCNKSEAVIVNDITDIIVHPENTIKDMTDINKVITGQ